MAEYNLVSNPGTTVEIPNEGILGVTNTIFYRLTADKRQPEITFVDNAGNLSGNVSQETRLQYGHEIAMENLRAWGVDRDYLNDIATMHGENLAVLDYIWLTIAKAVTEKWVEKPLSKTHIDKSYSAGIKAISDGENFQYDPFILESLNNVQKTRRPIAESKLTQLDTAIDNLVLPEDVRSN